MARAISLFGFSGGFLMLSPKLRQSLADSMQGGVQSLDQNSPWSYVGVGVLMVLAFLVFLGRSSKAQ